MDTLHPKLLLPKSLPFSMPYLVYHLLCFAGLILEMQWQTHFDFAIGASVAMFVQRNQKSEKEGQQAEEEGIHK